MIALAAPPSCGLRPPSPIKGEGPTEDSRPLSLLPLWEKVPEGRMRGEPHTQGFWEATP